MGYFFSVGDYLDLPFVSGTITDKRFTYAGLLEYQIDNGSWWLACELSDLPSDLDEEIELDILLEETK